jgi:DOPA 4,5-dioxygenase
MIPEIKAFHAHIYYDPAAERDAAARIREEAARLFPVRVGRMHDVPVGPHDRAMFQLAFTPEVFAEIVPWLMLNRSGLAVLVHPETGRPRDDHLQNALWMGAVLPLKGEVLPERE